MSAFTKQKDHYDDKTWNGEPFVHDFYAQQLKVIGVVPSGINILRVPNMSYPFAQLFVDVLPLTLIG